MTAAVDVGNTAIAYAVFQGSQVVREGRMPTYGDWSFPFDGVERAVIASVVPAVNARLLQELSAYSPLLLTRDMLQGLDTGDYDVSNLGMDRLVDLYAARELYGLPVAVFDSGTCLTVSVLGSGGRFLGGMIAPGIQTSLKALHNWTRTLPEVEAGPCRSLLGTDTHSCLLSGTVVGAAAMVDGFLSRIEEETGETFTAVLTGGFSELVLPWLRHDVKHEPRLQLQGLLLVSSTLR